MVLPELGIEVTKINGGEAWALCPGPHAKRVGDVDRHPSWSVNLTSGQHFCFSCGWGGPFIALIRYTEDLDDKQAERWIKDHGGMDYVRSRLEGRVAFEKEKAEAVTEARMVMFDDPPEWALKEKDVSLASCLAYGVRWNPGRDTWIFPIRDPVDNHLMGWQEKGGGYFNNFPKHVEKSLTIFGYHLLPPGQQAKVEESPIDAVRLHTYGIEGGVSTYGAHVSDEQVALLADRTQDVMWCFDNDGPGRHAEREMFNAHRKRFRKMWFAAYDPKDPKDHGEMPIRDVRWSLDHAVSKMSFHADR